MRLNCCHIGCLADAEYEILTVRRTADGDGIAGPDPYSDYTHACGAHVGELLSFQPDCVEAEHVYWHVRTLSEAEIAMTEGSPA